MSGFMRVFGKELTYYNTEMMAAQESHDTEFWNNVMSKFMSVSLNFSILLIPIGLLRLSS